MTCKKCGSNNINVVMADKQKNIEQQNVGCGCAIFVVIFLAICIYIAPVNRTPTNNTNHTQSNTSTSELADPFDEAIIQSIVKYNLGSIKMPGITPAPNWAKGKRYQVYTDKGDYTIYFNGTSIVSIRDSKTLNYISNNN